MSTLLELDTFTPGSPEWAEQRASRVGGSEIAAILGLSPWESHFSLWHRKQGLVGPVEDSAEMEWGRRLEGVVASKFFEAHPELERLGGTTVTREDKPFMIASPDDRARNRDTGETEVVEIKTALYDTGWGQPGTDQIPVYYLCQVRWYLACFALRRAHVAVLIGGSDYREYVVERDLDDEQILLTAGAAFIDSITAGVRPDIDAHSETYQVVRELHPEIDPAAAVELAPDVAEEYLLADQTLRQADADMTRMKSVVTDLMGVAKYATHAESRIAFRTARAKRDGTPGVPYLQISRAAVKKPTLSPRNEAA